MEVKFYIDDETNLPHIFGHGILEKEVLDVLEEPGEDITGRDGTRVATGQTTEGRYLRVIYVFDREAGEIFVITAYEIRGTTLKAYKRRRNKK